MPLGWEVERARGPASAFHARVVPDPARRLVSVLEVDRPALVLGSAQPDGAADRAACARAGVEVVRRRSGGGAVLLVPGEVLWVDVVVPRRDPLWHDDVGVASHWLGRVWAGALGALGSPGEVHTGGLERTRWAPLVCFAALGPGEVTIAGRKVVGISQRRTRAAARFQCALLARWDPAALLTLLALDDDTRDAAQRDLADVAAGASAPLADIERALLAALP